MPRLPVLTAEQVRKIYLVTPLATFANVVLQSVRFFESVQHSSEPLTMYHAIYCLCTIVKLILIDLLILFVGCAMCNIIRWYLNRTTKRQSPHWPSIQVYASTAGMEPKECSICLEGIQNGDQVRSLRCGHMFHAACIDEWLAVRPRCGYCLARVIPHA